MSEIEYFKFEVKPWIFGPGDARPSEWRVEVQADGEKYGLCHVFPRIPWNESELDVFLRSAIEEFRKVMVRRESQ